jgi:hypothetical protein
MYLKKAIIIHQFINVLIIRGRKVTPKQLMMLFIYSPALATAVDCINICFHTGSIRTPADENRLGGMGSHHSVRDPVAVRHHSVWVNWLLPYLFFLLV